MKIVPEKNVTVVNGLFPDLVKRSGLVDKFYSCGFDNFMETCRHNKNFYSYTVLDINVPVAYIIAEACYGFDNFLWIHLMYVDEGFRGNKFPAMMIHGMIEALDFLGLDQIRANIGDRDREWWEKVSGGYKIKADKVITYYHKGG